MKKDIVIFDIDGTLANIDHRRPFVENLNSESQDWKSFLHTWNVIKDVPDESISMLAKMCSFYGFKVYLASGRPECLRETTELWLKESHIYYDQLFMRKDGDFRKDDIIKEEFLKEIDKERILFIVDDRKCVVDMWRKHNIKVLQCAEGLY